MVREWVRRCAALSLLFASILAAGCPGNPPGSADPRLVSIAISPGGGTVSKGDTLQFVATGTFADGSQTLLTSVTWTSSDLSVATISGTGLATGVSSGNSSIQVYSGSVQASVTLTVTAAAVRSITVSPADRSVVAGGNQQFTATGKLSDGSIQNITNSVTWASSNTTTAMITSSGLAFGLQQGTTSISATLGSVSGSTSLSVTAATLVSIAVTVANASVALGNTLQFEATGTFSNNSTQDLTNSVTWASSNTTAATISLTGLAKGVTAGQSTTISATEGLVSGSTNLYVTAPALVSITVTPTSSVTAGYTLQFAATGTFNDNSAQDLTNSVIWSSSDTTIATISATGCASTLQQGIVTISAAQGSIVGSATLMLSSSNFAGVLTYHNDSARTGQNLTEIALTPSNVNINQFGKLFSQPVDGQMYAQPLYVPNVAMRANGNHNVIFAATEMDSVYAFDADDNSGVNASPLWHASLIDTAHGAAPGETPFSTVGGCTDLQPNVGITSTPVIDPSTGTMYVEAKSQQADGTLVHRLHMLDITTGAEKGPGPVVITATVSGTGDGSSAGQLTFDSAHQLNRPGLLLLNGAVYVGFASHCDGGPYHGWLFAYDEATLAQTGVFVSTPNGGDGGFWMSGAGFAADPNGNIFGATGNGTFSQSNPLELGDSILRFNFSNGTLSVTDYFTPFNQDSLNSLDNDLGSGGVLLLPDQPGSHPHVLLQAGKEGRIYVVDRDQMTTNNIHYCASDCGDQDAEIVQESGLGVVGGVFGMPAYWNNNVYFRASGDFVKSIPVANGTLDFSHITSSTTWYGYPGTTPSISANGTSDGIVWSIDSSQYGGPGPGPGPAVLHAHDATNVATELWNSAQAPNNRDIAGNAVKFTVPTIANGKVYIGTSSEIDVYGRLPGT